MEKYATAYTRRRNLSHEFFIRTVLSIIMLNFSTMDVAGFGHQVGENCNEADDFTIK